MASLKGLLHHCRRKVVLQQALAQIGCGPLADRGPSEDLLVRVASRLPLLVVQSALSLFPARGAPEALRARRLSILAADGNILDRMRQAEICAHGSSEEGAASRAAISALSAASMSALDATMRYFFLPLLGAGVNDSFSAGRSMTGIS